MRGVTTRIRSAAGLIGSLLFVSPAQAVVSNPCDPATYEVWSEPTTSVGVASAPAHDTGFGVAGSRSYFAQGKKLLAFRNVAAGAFAAGTKAWEWCYPNYPVCSTGTTLRNFPSPVPVSTPALHGGQPEFLFIGGEDGWLYKIRASDGVNVDSADTRRMIGGAPVCTAAPGDALNATPAVVLYAYASTTAGSPGAAFRADIDSTPGHAGDDVVIVFTANGCGDTTRNRIIAYWASDLTVKWTFNQSFERKVDRGSEGCAIDYETMRVYCGSDLPDGATGQSSLFAIDVITGALVWSTNAGAILNRPTLNFNNGRLYVARKSGSLMAYDRAGDGLGGGQPLWSSPISVAATGSIVTRPPVVETRAGTWQNKILVLDSAGVLHAVTDNGSSASLMWNFQAESGVQYRSLPVVVPGSPDRAYVGRDDGTLQMITLGAVGATANGAIYIEPDTDVNDASLDLEGTQLRLVVTAGSTIKRLSLPLCAQAPF